MSEHNQLTIATRPMRPVVQLVLLACLIPWMGLWSNPSAAADFSGGDDFNDNLKDGTKWGPDLTMGTTGGQLSEYNQSLEFTFTTAGHAVAIRPWMLNYGSYTNNWELQAELTVGQVGLYAGDSWIEMFLAVGNAGDLLNGIPRDRLTMSLDLNPSGTRKAYAYLATNNVDVGDPEAYALGVYSQTIVARLSFDAATKTLSAYCDPDGFANGANWTLLRTVNLGPSGGNDWQMDNSSRFMVVLGSSCQNAYVISYHQCYADNFRAQNQADTTLALGAALETTNLVWWTGGAAPWTVQTSSTHDGVDAAQSGSITTGQESWIQTTVIGPGTLTYWGKVSAATKATLAFFLDDLQLNSISGTTNWQKMTNIISAGTHTLKWRFTCSGTLGGCNEKAAWLDEVALLTYDGAPVFLTSPQSRIGFLRNSVSFSMVAAGTAPLNYQWYRNGSPIAGADQATLTLDRLQWADAGSYQLVVNNAYGSVTSVVAVLTVSPIAAWGDNSSGQTTVPTSLGNVLAIAAGELHSLALKADGTVVTWGRGYAVPTGLGTVVAIAAGGLHNLALKADGTVVAWGYNEYGQATVPAGLTNAVAIAAGGYHSLALKADGTITAWGYNTLGETTVPAGLNNVVAIAAGNHHSLALKADGTVVAWGYDASGQATVPAGLSAVVALAGGYDHSLALRADGTVTAWGSQTTVPAGLTNVVAIAAGQSYSLALKADRTLAAWGSQTAGPAGLTNVVAIAAGRSHSLALTELVAGPPQVFSQPVDQIAYLGAPATLFVEASSLTPPAYQWRFNGLAIAGATNRNYTILNVQTTHAGLYSVVVSNTFGVVASSNAALSVVLTNPWTLALDLPGQLWSAGGTVPWFSQTTNTHDGTDAAQSGAITNNQESWLQTMVTGPGTLTYWWKVSSEFAYDYLEFYLDDLLQSGRISGESGWRKMTNTIPAGSHTVKWRYSKDGYGTSGQDAAWLDEISFVGPVPLQFAMTGGTLFVSNGWFNLRLAGPANTNVVVECSTNLASWVAVLTNAMPAGGLPLSLPMGPNRCQFYRAKPLP